MPTSLYARLLCAAAILHLVLSVTIYALGLVLVNVGTLFRLRYVCLMLLIMLAAKGATYILARLRNDPWENREREVAG